VLPWTSSRFWPLWPSICQDDIHRPRPANCSPPGKTALIRCRIPGRSEILAEVFGTGEPLAFEPAWRTPDVLQLARAVYHGERTPLPGRLERTGLLLLANALLDAGCSAPAILAHLRSRGRHVRGCAVLDLILGQGEAICPLTLWKIAHERLVAAREGHPGRGTDS
jgi:hypothetical protein